MPRTLKTVGVIIVSNGPTSKILGQDSGCEYMSSFWTLTETLRTANGNAWMECKLRYWV